MKQILVTFILFFTYLNSSEFVDKNISTNKLEKTLFSINDINYTKEIFPKEFENASLERQKEFISKYVFYKILLEKLKDKKVIYNKQIQKNIELEKQKQKRIGEILSPLKKMFFEKKIIVDTIAYNELLKKEDNITKKAMDFYNKNKKGFYFPKRVELSLIVVETKDLAIKILKKLKSNDIQLFSKLAKEYSILKSKQYGGYVGFVPEGGIDNFNILYNSKKGELVPQVLKIKNKYMIAYLLDKSKEEQKSFLQLKDDIRKFLLKKKIHSWSWELFNIEKEKVELTHYL